MGRCDGKCGLVCVGPVSVLKSTIYLESVGERRSNSERGLLAWLFLSPMRLRLCGRVEAQHDGTCLVVCGLMGYVGREMRSEDALCHQWRASVGSFLDSSGSHSHGR